MPRGGYHQHAVRWGRKSAWQNDSPTKTIRVPESLIEQILDYAHKLDDRLVTDSDTQAIKEVDDFDTQAKEPDLEELCDRYLATLKLGKQAPEYKRIKKALDGFIAFIQSTKD